MKRQVNKGFFENYIFTLEKYDCGKLLSKEAKDGFGSYPEIVSLIKENEVEVTDIRYLMIIDGVLTHGQWYYVDTPPLPFEHESGEPGHRFTSSLCEIGFEGGERDILFLESALDYIRGINTSKDREAVQLPDKFKFYPATAEELLAAIASIKNPRNKINSKNILGWRDCIIAAGTVFEIKDMKNGKTGTWMLCYKSKEKKFDFISAYQHWESPWKSSKVSFLTRQLSH